MSPTLERRRVGEVLTLTCAACGSEFEWVVKASRPRKHCSERCRKSQYDKACSDCGTRIDGTTPERASGLCRACADAERSRRTRERHIDAIQRWAALHATKALRRRSLPSPPWGARGWKPAASMAAFQLPKTAMTA